jgi:hypothetical protein
MVPTHPGATKRDTSPLVPPLDKLQLVLPKQEMNRSYWARTVFKLSKDLDGTSKVVVKVNFDIVLDRSISKSTMPCRL